MMGLADMKPPPNDIQLAIHHSNAGFHPRWVAYCEEQGIPFKRVDCHASDIIQQLSDCNGLLWHHSQMNPRDLLVAKAILSVNAGAEGEAGGGGRAGGVRAPLVGAANSVAMT